LVRGQRVPPARVRRRPVARGGDGLGVGVVAVQQSRRARARRAPIQQFPCLGLFLGGERAIDRDDVGAREPAVAALVAGIGGDGRGGRRARARAPAARFATRGRGGVGRDRLGRGSAGGGGARRGDVRGGGAGRGGVRRGAAGRGGVGHGGARVRGGPRRGLRPPRRGLLVGVGTPGGAVAGPVAVRSRARGGAGVVGTPVVPGAVLDGGHALGLRVARS